VEYNKIINKKALSNINNIFLKIETLQVYKNVYVLLLSVSYRYLFKSLFVLIDKKKEKLRVYLQNKKIRPSLSHRVLFFYLLITLFQRCNVWKKS